MDNITFGNHLEKLRMERSMSQRKLAELSGLTNSTISRIESGLVKPDQGTVEKLAEALKVDKFLLLSRADDSEIPEGFVVIARKAGDLSTEDQQAIFKLLNNTIDDYISRTSNSEEE